MALPSVNINVVNGALGLVPASEDGTVGMLLQGIATGSLSLLTPAVITSLADAEALGLTEAYDTTNTVRVWKHIRDFYATAGTNARLWIMLTSQAVSMEDMVDVSEANYAKKLLDAAQGEVRLLAVTRSPASGYTPTVTNGIDVDVENAINLAQALATAYTAAFTPIRVILEARHYNGNTANLSNLKARDDNRVQVMLGDTVTGGGAAVGLLMGRYASDPVQRNPGRVKTGSVPINDVYLGSETLAQATLGDVAAINDKGFVTLRTYAGRAGFYFTDDPTCTAATDDYSSLARGRVIDKAIRLAYVTYVNEILDEVEVNPTTGRIAAVKARYYEAIIESQINTSMTSVQEVVSVRAVCDAAQNVLSTNRIVIQLRVVPFGYAKEIVVNLGFDNPANS